MTIVKVPTDPRLREASEAGQKPPTDSNAVRQRYQLGCHAAGGSSQSYGGSGGSGSGGSGGVSRQRTRSRQFNRGY